MDKELIQNINKVSFLQKKLAVIDKQLQNKNYLDSYKAVAMLIETICVIVLQKVYHEDLQNSNIVVLATSFERHNENDIKELLIDINGEYNSIKLSEVNELDTLDLVGRLDNIVKIVLDKYPTII